MSSSDVALILLMLMLLILVVYIAPDPKEDEKRSDLSESRPSVKHVAHVAQ